MKHDSTPKTAHLAIYIHIIAWVLLFTFPLLMEDHSEGIRWNEYFRRLSIPVSFFIIFYANYWLLVPKFLLKKERSRYLLYNVLLIAVLLVFFHLFYLKGLHCRCLEALVKPLCELWACAFFSAVKPS